MKKSIVTTLVCASLCCAGVSVVAESESLHTIGVLTYSSTADEPQAFRGYLTDYIETCFDVQFIFSSDITTQEQELEFIQMAADYGVEGIMSFNSFDLAQEVELCEKNGIYYMLSSSTIADDVFQTVSENPYFLGVVGPGEEEEYQTGVAMADYFIENQESRDYFIISGGASLGNKMHLERTVGILDEIQKRCNVTFEKTSEELALSAKATHAESGDVKVCIMPGYVEYDVFQDAAREEYQKDQYSNVLSVIPATGMKEDFHNAHLGIVDCYCENNLLLMEEGELSFVAGKYGSMIGPSFAAMYNAITGHADTFREDGKAFHISQGFWVSDTKEDYLEKYMLACSLEINAYNYEDIEAVCAEYQTDVSLDDLKKLAAAYTYEEVKARREL